MGSSGFRVREVEEARDLIAFIKFPWRVYRDDKYWVLPLITERRDFLDPKKNPFFEHSEVALFLAQRDGETVGTIAAIMDHNFNQFQGEKVGWFGLFEVVEDYDVAEGLLGVARDRVKEKGMEAIRGPVNMSTNNEYALLVDGFDSSPVVMMTYNPPHYAGFIERFGFVTAQNLYAYIIEMDILGNSIQNLPRKILRVAEATRRRGKIRVCKVRLEDWDAEDGDRPVGVSVGIPDVNQALLKANPCPSPWSVPWTLAKFLWYRREIDAMRLLIMGVVEK